MGKDDKGHLISSSLIPPQKRAEHGLLAVGLWSGCYRMCESLLEKLLAAFVVDNPDTSALTIVPESKE